MTSARVALLIPAYNCQQRLDCSTASLPREIPLRIFVVDDGSDPPLVDPPFDAKQHTLEIVRLNSNRGIAQALRHGVDRIQAEGVEYIARLDAGDLALAGRFAAQLAFLENRPDVVLVGSACEVVREDRGLLYVMRPPLTDKKIRKNFFLRTCFFHTAVMMRTEAVVAAGNYDDVYPSCEDMDLFFRLLQQGEGANLEETYTQFDVQVGGLSSTKRQQQVKSFLRLQMANFRGGNPRDMLAMCRSVAHLCLPRQVVEHAKARLFGTGAV